MGFVADGLRHGALAALAIRLLALRRGDGLRRRRRQAYRQRSKRAVTQAIGDETHASHA